MCFYQCNFLFPSPLLDFGFPRDAIVDVFERLKIDQSVYPISLREAVHLPVFVLRYSAFNTIRHAGVYSTRLARQNIKVKFPLEYQSRFLASLGMTNKRVYFPLHFGSRFSIQAFIPSRASSVFISSSR